MHGQVTRQTTPTAEVDGRVSVGQPVAWYRLLDRQQWNTLLAANLGWLFDGYETYALILTVAVALRELLNPSELPRLPFYAGAVIATTLFGWGIGGIVGGIVADYVGRKRMMMYSILSYALLTGLSALAWSWESFAVLRLLVGIAIGSEWGTGTSMMAEMWPPHARGKGAGLMQCGLGMGFFVASLIWVFVSGAGPGAWRFMFLLGVLPALATLWIRRNIVEPEMWVDVDRRRRAARAAQARGHTLDEEGRAHAQFTLAALFSDPRLRGLTIVGSLMSLTTTVAWWGVSTWVPPYVATLGPPSVLSPEQWSGIAGMAYNVGAVAGYISLGFAADRFGRKPVTAAYFLLSLILTPVLFLWVHDISVVLIVTVINGFFTLGQYTWMPTWLPEVFPTRVRATGVSFVFNAARFVAFLGPLVAGTLIGVLGGYSVAATLVGLIYILGLVAVWFFPETRGKPLPT
jgi:MFS family permease